MYKGNKQPYKMGNLHVCFAGVIIVIKLGVLICFRQINRQSLSLNLQRLVLIIV